MARQSPTTSSLSSLFRWIAEYPAFRSLRHRNYRLFFFGQLLSLVGTWMQNVGQAWLVYQLTQSAAWLGTIGFLQSLPLLLFSMFGGALADKLSKKKVIVATQAASMAQAVLLALLVWTNWITPIVVGILAFLLGVINAFDMPSRQSFVIEMVGEEDLTNAIALNSAAFNTARMIGPAIGGIIISTMGIEWCFLLNGLSFLAVIFGLLRMAVEESGEQGRTRKSVLESISISVSYVRKNIAFTALLILVAVLTIFGWSYTILLPVFADRVLHIGAIGLGNLLTSNGIGALISALTIASLSHKVPSRVFIFAGLIIFVFSALIFSASTDPYLSMVCMIGIGMGLISFFATANAFVQRNSPSDMRGILMGLYLLIFQGFFPIGSLGVGFYAHYVGPQIALATGASACGIAGITVYYALRRWRLKSESQTS